MKKHPSGRPIRKEEIRGRPMWRIPEDGPVIPRLRPNGLASAIGFTNQYLEKTDEGLLTMRKEDHRQRE